MTSARGVTMGIVVHPVRAKGGADTPRPSDPDIVGKIGERHDPGIDPDLAAATAAGHPAHRWPALHEVQGRYRAGFAYVDGLLADGQVLRLCRLRYAGSAHNWGCAIYRASHDDHENSYLPIA